MNFELEVIAFDLASCFIAERAGAHRIELCANPLEGGTTPSHGMINLARKSVKIQLFPIIRPRGGNFLYDHSEFLSMVEDIKVCKEEGCDGVVMGMLNENGHINTDACHELIYHAKGMEITFHRAFDRVKDQEAALNDVIRLGCKRILTSGGFPTAHEGRNQLRKLIDMSEDKITIMVGSGIKSSNIKNIQESTGAKAFHASARTHVSTPHTFNPVTMKETLEKITLDETELILLRSTLENIFN